MKSLLVGQVAKMVRQVRGRFGIYSWAYRLTRIAFNDDHMFHKNISDIHYAYLLYMSSRL